MRRNSKGHVRQQAKRIGRALSRARPGPRQPRLGEVLGGRYRLEGVIATGGSATVYECADVALHQTVAVKVVTRPQGLGTGDGEVPFGLRTEAAACLKLSHPGVVRVYNYECEDGHELLVMERLLGQDLASCRRNAPEHRLPFSDVMFVAQQLLPAVQHVHSAGVVHHDIKPANVIWTRDREVKLIDFGLARIVDAAPAWREGLVAGTAQFLSPERLFGREGDARSDQYSVGAMLYLLATGRAVYSRDPVQIARALTHGERPSRAGLAVPVYEVLCRAMALRPDDRYRDVAQLLEALETARDGETSVRIVRESRPVSRPPAADAEAPRTIPPLPESGEMVRVGGHCLRSAYDGSIHDVPPAFMDATPVTNHAFSLFLKECDELAPDYWLGPEPPAQLLDHPVTNITLAQARAFATWAGKRLPRSLEWEAAARGPEQLRFPWGDELVAAHCHGPARGRTGTTAVDTHPAGASAAGCLDMLGNVWEWTEPDAADAESAWVYGGSFRHPVCADQAIARSRVGTRSAYRYLGFRCAKDV